MMDGHEHQGDGADFISPDWTWGDAAGFDEGSSMNEDNYQTDGEQQAFAATNPQAGYASPWWMSPTAILPWWMRSELLQLMWQGPDWTRSLSHRGWWSNHWFVDSYPVLGSYYASPSIDPAFIDPWTMQSYPGPWWP